MESKELEIFEKSDDENIFESKWVLFFMEEIIIVKEVMSYVFFFLKYIVEINNEEFFEEVDEIVIKESN